MIIVDVGWLARAIGAFVVMALASWAFEPVFVWLGLPVFLGR